MALRSIITAQASSISVNVRRGAADDRWAAWRTAQAIAEELSASPPANGLIHGPYGSEGMTDSYVPPARAGINLPTIASKEQYGSAVRCSIVNYQERAALIRQIEEVVAQHTTHVDSLPAIGWCLDGQFPTRHPRHGQPGEYEQAERAVAPREAARVELLQPFTAGRYPVKLPDLFAEFNVELSPLERAVVRSSFDGSIHAFSVRNVMSEPGIDPAQLSAAWVALTKRLIALDWLSPAARSFSYDDPAWLPRVQRGPKSKLLPDSQHLI